MSLAAILNIPDDDTNLDWWAFYNDQQHQAIVQAIQTKFGIRLDLPILYPVNSADMEGWLERHAQAHNDLNAVLGYLGSDLEEVDLNEPKQRDVWEQLHFAEHQHASQVLNIE